ncbi:sensor histidine kinase [Pedobacter miscanthi]|uniref:sensor histidine kinase n=1 Tax=Pedobacter miscanthi TaxID=2259170 RepID=UPI00292D8636|nr:histidine kinase [Pedobacter miscanthi]
MHIESEGNTGSSMKTTVRGKLVSIYTIGGFIKFRPTSTFTTSSHQLYYRWYFEDSVPQSASNSGAVKEVALSGHANQVYLDVNKEVFMDILDRQKDTLVCRYIIKRIKAIPKVKLYSQRYNKELPFLISSLDNHPGELKISPGDQLKISIVGDTKFKDLEVEYTLLNLKTRRSEHGISKTGFESLKLSANTEYQLRVNYVLQQQSVGIGYLRIAPYWYQSAVTYVLISTVVIAFGFLLVTAVLKNKIKSSRKQQQKLEEAAVRLQSLLNPHFTFNALSSVQGLMNTDRIEEANFYLQEFSSLLRKTLSKSQQVFNSLDQELEMMRMYIRLEALRFNFSWDIEISAKLNAVDIQIPTLFIQPLVENAVKHGLKRLGNKGHLLIICKETQEKNTFVIVVKDNGTWLEKSLGTGYGLSLTAERIWTINKMKKGQEIALHFNKQQGTEAVLTFHNWIDN